MERKTNTCAVVGFILSFFCGIAGLIVSIVALKQIKKTGEKGKGLAIAGIIIPCVSIVIAILISVFYVVFVMPSITGSIEASIVCVNGAYYSYGSYGEAGYINCGRENYDGTYVCTYTDNDGYTMSVTCQG